MSVLKDVTLSLCVIGNAPYRILTLIYVCSTLSLSFFFLMKVEKTTREVRDALRCKEQSTERGREISGTQDIQKGTE